MNAQDEALALLARARGLLDPDRVARAGSTRRLPGEGLGELLVRERLVAAPGELVRLLDQLRAARFQCARCGRAETWAGLAALTALRCRTCQGPLEPPAALAWSSSALVRSDTGGGVPIPQALPEPPCTLGPWQLLSRLGRGSHGVVYLAKREGLERRFALKLLHQGLQQDEEELARFQLEANAASKVQDPGVIAVLDVGRTGPFAWYAMEHCPGPTLKERLRDGPLPWREAAQIVAWLARTVAAAHAVGVLHRDLKPANVIMDPALGRPRLTDFGLARRSDMERSLTRSGDVLGTPLYMAPEQLRGEKARDPRVDVYGLGSVLYACLTGDAPHQADTIVALTHQKLHVDPAPPHTRAPEVPRQLSAICLRALRRDPVARTPSAQALADELERLLAQPEAQPAARATARGPRGWLIALGLILGGVVGAAAALALRGQRPSPTGGAPPAAQPAPSAPPARPAPPAPAPAEPAFELDWAVCCYMPYDNHLSRLGEGILAELARGVTSPRVAVAVQADFQGPGGARRYLFRRTPGGDPSREVTEYPEGEESADPASFRAFLGWAQGALRARHVAVVLLGPSGGLSQTCLDQHPTRRFLEVPELNSALLELRGEVRARGGEVELLFLQQSARGLLELLHALRGTARVLLAAQTGLGAPNSYYVPVLQQLGEAPGPTDGAALARAIMAADGEDMFTAYAALDGSALDELPARLDPLLDALLRAPGRPVLTTDALAPAITSGQGSELHADALGLLAALEGELPVDPALRRQLADWVRGRLVVGARVSPRAPPQAAEWCGASLFVPRTAAELVSYDERWPLVRDTHLRQLWLRVYGQ